MQKEARPPSTWRLRNLNQLPMQVPLMQALACAAVYMPYFGRSPEIFATSW